MWAINDIVSLITAVLVVIIGAVVTRALHRHDTRLSALKEQEAALEVKKEERMSRIERTLSRHTRSLSALGRSQKLTVETIARHSEDLEELEDVTEQLQNATRVNRERIEKSDEVIRELRESRLRRVD